MYEEDLGVVDFHPSMSMGVIYLSEADIITGTAYKRKLVKFRKVVIRCCINMDSTLQLALVFCDTLGMTRECTGTGFNESVLQGKTTLDPLYTCMHR